jgi:hypothetical protein
MLLLQVYRPNYCGSKSSLTIAIVHHCCWYTFTMILSSTGCLYDTSTVPTLWSLSVLDMVSHCSLSKAVYPEQLSGKALRSEKRHLSCLWPPCECCPNIIPIHQVTVAVGWMWWFFTSIIWSRVSGLMQFRGGSDKGTASNFVQWLHKRSGKKARKVQIHWDRKRWITKSRSTLIIFFDSIHNEFVLAGQTVNSAYYGDILWWLHENVQELHPELWQQNITGSCVTTTHHLTFPLSTREFLTRPGNYRLKILNIRVITIMAQCSHRHMHTYKHKCTYKDMYTSMCLNKYSNSSKCKHTHETMALTFVMQARLGNKNFTHQTEWLGPHCCTPSAPRWTVLQDPGNR